MSVLEQFDLTGKVAVVTGGNRGLGEAWVRSLVDVGATVVIAARDPARAETVGEEIRLRVPLARVETVTADLSSLAQVRRLADEVRARYDRLDVLVNNAGVITMRRRLTADGFETTFATNHLAPFLLTNLLRGLLERSAPARVVTVASAAHKQVRAIPWDDLATGEAAHTRAYPLSKLCNILFTRELAKRLDGSGVTANSLHPGFIRTNLGRDFTGAAGRVVRFILRFQPGPAAGAVTSVYLASSPEVAGTTGGYFVKSRPARPSALASDPVAAARLWALSEELTSR
jgi:NAD(P)-dependent dehydrogenase (short-subunit alcohol dehydrogenase family)